MSHCPFIFYQTVEVLFSPAEEAGEEAEEEAGDGVEGGLEAGDGWEVFGIDGGFPKQTDRPYGYIDPAEPCWFVHPIQNGFQRVGGDSRLVLVSKQSGRVLTEYTLPGK